MVPVLCAFHTLLTQICYWVLPSMAVQASPHVEKVFAVTEKQPCGTTRRHCFTADSAPAPGGDYSACNVHANYQQVGRLYCILVQFILITALKYTAFRTATNLSQDDLFDVSYSSMPPLERMGSMPSL